MLSLKQFREIRKIAKKYKCRIYWAYNLDKHPYGGCVSRDKPGNIILVSDDNFTKLLSVLFHEIGHVHCYRNNKWTAYHKAENVKAFKLTALKAERWVDNWAENEFKKYYPDKDYWKSDYSSKESVKWFKDYFKEMFI